MNAKDVFETLRSFRRTENPQQQLIAYCKSVLGETEGYQFDFKQKSDPRVARLGDDDKKNLAKAVSGFANSSGGVLVWGVEDRTLQPKPICDIRDCMRIMLELAPLLTDPTVPGIDGDWIQADGTSEHEGFGLVFVPESSLPPHRVILSKTEVKDRYYQRSGSVFSVASHAQLEDMFGRRPKPQLELSAVVVKGDVKVDDSYGFRVILGLHNTGRGLARAPYLAIRLTGFKVNKLGLDGNRNYGLTRLVASDSGWRIYGGRDNEVVHSGTILEVTAVQGRVSTNADNNLSIDYKIAAEGTPLKTGSMPFDSEDLKRQVLELWG